MSEKPMPKLPFHFVRNIFLFVLLAGLTFWSGYIFGVKGYRIDAQNATKVNITRETPIDKTELEFSLFWRVWDIVHTKYYDKTKITDSELVYGAIRGMVASVGDPYTVFLQPTENKIVEEDLKGSFDGVGIQIGFKGNQLAVIAPLPESPAEKAGIKAGDYIVGIKDEAKKIEKGTVGMTLEEAVQIIRGPKNSKVTLSLLREGEKQPIIVEVARQSIDVPSVTVKYLGEDESIAHVKLSKFAGETLDEWEKAVAELVKNPNLKGIVMDLRNNPGGYLQGAVELASDFLETGDVVVVEQDYTGTKQLGKVEKIGRLRGYKLVVLVNGGSASASEIFAGAIRDHKKGQLVGEKTFGKGTIQEPEQIAGGSGLHITIAKWLTPNETWVHGEGLKPDHEIEDNEETENDEQLDKAAELLK